MSPKERKDRGIKPKKKKRERIQGARGSLHEGLIMLRKASARMQKRVGQKERRRRVEVERRRLITSRYRTYSKIQKTRDRPHYFYLFLERGNKRA